MRALDDDLPGARGALRAIYPHGGRAFVVGVTGAPGVGKSTLVDALIGAARARGERVAVVAVDPSSPFSGGALLGDRVRMQRHAHRRGRVHPLAGDARAAGRAVALDDGGGRRARRRRFPADLRRDRGGRAGGDRRRRRGRRRHRRDGARARRRGAGAEGGAARDRGRPGREQGRPRRRGSRAGGSDHDARPGGAPVAARGAAARGARRLLRASASRAAPASRMSWRRSTRSGPRRRPSAPRAGAVRRCVRSRRWWASRRAPRPTPPSGPKGAPGPLASTADRVAARKLDPWSAAEALATAR